MRRKAQIVLVAAALGVAGLGCGEKDEPQVGTGPETTLPATTPTATAPTGTTPPATTTTAPAPDQP